MLRDRQSRFTAACHAGLAGRRIGVCAVEIKSASREIQLLPAGPFRATDGRPKQAPHWRLDRERFKAWLAQAAKSSTHLAIDYEHESLPDKHGRRRKWSAAGWFTAAGIEIRDDGVWATDVEWTDAAKALIEAREVAYISPVFFYDETGAVFGLATHVAPAALTNTPAIDGMQPALQAAAAQLATGAQHMNDLIELLGLPEDASEDDIVAAVRGLQDALAEARGQVESIAAESQAAAAKGVAGDGTGGDARKRIRELRDAGMSLEDISRALEDMPGDVERSAGTLSAIANGEIENPPESLIEALDRIEPPEPESASRKSEMDNPDPQKYVSVKVVEDLRSQIAALSAERTADKVAELVNEGLEDGRLLPAQKEWAEALGKKDLAALSQYLESAEPIAGLRASQTGGHEPDEDTGEHALTEDQLAVCTQMGIPPEDYAKFLKEAH